MIEVSILKYNEIEKKRMQMFLLAQKYGMTSERTIRCSQELDELLNDIQHNVSSSVISTIR
ncbi:aspartyl-phosphate phosphatase Spo0E family protein [Alkalicoccobacillus plakortidis]|uniref:Aspartyl-phosphate phosphatase Spo0E family protein n=1 Tax=Alkalicoccobacillus plakortidis TaxID=444060 RepID=A0ABT0XF28_9BACI|nr:aspartyl-phosphate phosphatase Spo0E family protein [Alkalicoccobacillus plakortidis]MCM2674400.1 aspartyl-phosphate phosphatase Spo0E family protein [Alkalicoccobacillus plakortidis]